MQGRCNADPSQDSVTVLITDSCPECEADHIDMQALTFNKVRKNLCTTSLTCADVAGCSHAHACICTDQHAL